MNVGDNAWVAYIGTEAGTGCSVRKVEIVERLPASWAVIYQDNEFRHVRKHFDKAKDSRMFPTRAEAVEWLTHVLRGRVQAAEMVLEHRKQILNKWEVEMLKI